MTTTEAVWINSLDSLPTTDRWVLIHCPRNYDLPVWVARWDARERVWRNENGDAIVRFVRHWADMPEAPEGL
jgi:hypothetical protein